MDMRREQEPRAEAAIRELTLQACVDNGRKFQQTHAGQAEAAAPSACNNDYAAQQLNAEHPLPPRQLVEKTIASPLFSMALADWQRGRDASRSTGGAGGPVPELVKRMLAATQDSGGWASAEDELIRTSVRRLGCMWSVIAAALPGRSDVAVHSRWNRLDAMRTCGHQSVTLSHARRAATMQEAFTRQEHASCIELAERMFECRSLGYASSSTSMSSFQPLAAPPTDPPLPPAPFHPPAVHRPQPLGQEESVRPPVVRVLSCSKGCGQTFTHGRTAAWSNRRQHEETCMGGGVDPQWRIPCTAASAAAASTAASTAAWPKRADSAAGATKENVEMQRAPAAACYPSHALQLWVGSRACVHVVRDASSREPATIRATRRVQTSWLGDEYVQH